MSDAAPRLPESQPRKRVPPAFWVASTYFAEGFPYALINGVLEILFQQMGASLKVIGLTSLYHLPWNLKFLWGPFLDQYETKRRWLVGVEVALSIALLLFAFFVGGAGTVTGLIVISALLLALLSATHDIAIDGFYLEALDEKEQSTFVGFRATFYRLAALSLSGPLLWLIGRSSWFVGLLVIAVVMSSLTAFHAWSLPRTESRKLPLRRLLAAMKRPRALWMFGGGALLVAAEKQLSLTTKVGTWISRIPIVSSLSLSEWAVLMLVLLLLGAVWFNGRRKPRQEGHAPSPYVRAFTSFMDQERALLVLAFVLLFRTGESFLVKMRWPFLNEEVGMALEAYAFLNGTLGVIASFVATLAGGWMIGKWGLRRCIWPFVVSQNFLNLLYMWLAFRDVAPPPWLLGSVIAIEHAGAGLGTAVFMVYLMRSCDPAHKAAHMAILTALMSVSFTVAGVASGFLAESTGFGIYFGLTFVATVPSMLLIPWLPYLDHGRGRAPSAAGA